MSEVWQALAREAGLAAEHMAIGVSALQRANYAQHAYYGQAFFALSIGFERSTKLALVVDHAIDSGGSFPQHTSIRDYGHDLRKLLERCDEIAVRRGFSEQKQRLPATVIHDGIIHVLSTFATNITRYYNLDVVTRNPQVTTQTDPVSAWFELVTVPVLGTHYRARDRVKHEANATLIDELLGDNVMVQYTSETGEPLATVRDASLQTAATDAAKPYTRMYVMQIARFLALLLSDLGYISQKAGLETAVSG